MSDFAAQVIEDHPGLSVAEAKVVANTLLRCAVFAASLRNSTVGGHIMCEFPALCFSGP